MPQKFTATLCHPAAAITLTGGKNQLGGNIVLLCVLLPALCHSLCHSLCLPATHWSSNPTQDFLTLASAQTFSPPSKETSRNGFLAGGAYLVQVSPASPSLSPGLTACPPGGRQAHESSSHIALHHSLTSLTATCECATQWAPTWFRASAGYNSHTRLSGANVKSEDLC